MKRWIIEYFDIFTTHNETVVIVSNSPETAMKWFLFDNYLEGLCYPIMGIREDGSIGGGRHGLL